MLLMGNTPPTWIGARGFESLGLSPDGARLAFGDDVLNDVWVWDFARETLTQLTFSPSVDMNVMWTPDGSRVAFASARAGIPRHQLGQRIVHLVQQRFAQPGRRYHAEHWALRHLDLDLARWNLIVGAIPSGHHGAASRDDVLARGRELLEAEEDALNA